MRILSAEQFILETLSGSSFSPGSDGGLYSSAEDIIPRFPSGGLTPQRRIRIIESRLLLQSRMLEIVSGPGSSLPEGFWLGLPEPSVATSPRELASQIIQHLLMYHEGTTLNPENPVLRVLLDQVLDALPTPGFIDPASLRSCVVGALREICVPPSPAVDSMRELLLQIARGRLRGLVERSRGAGISACSEIPASSCQDGGVRLPSGAPSLSGPAGLPPQPEHPGPPARRRRIESVELPPQLPHGVPFFNIVEARAALREGGPPEITLYVEELAGSEKKAAEFPETMAAESAAPTVSPESTVPVESEGAVSEDTSGMSSVSSASSSGTSQSPSSADGKALLIKIPGRFFSPDLPAREAYGPKLLETAQARYPEEPVSLLQAILPAAIKIARMRFERASGKKDNESTLTVLGELLQDLEAPVRTAGPEELFNIKEPGVMTAIYCVAEEFCEKDQGIPLPWVRYILSRLVRGTQTGKVQGPLLGVVRQFVAPILGALSGKAYVPGRPLRSPATGIPGQFMAPRLCEAFLESVSQGLMDTDGIYDGFSRSCQGKRFFFNGRKFLDHAGRTRDARYHIQKKLKDWVDNPLLNPFLTFASSNDGLDSVLQDMLLPGAVGDAELAGFTAALAGRDICLPKNKICWDVKGKELTISRVYEVCCDIWNPFLDDYISIQIAELRTGLIISLEQDMAGRSLPEFTLLDCTVKPVGGL